MTVELIAFGCGIICGVFGYMIVDAIYLGKRMADREQL